MNLPTRLLVGTLRLYQRTLSRLLPATCRFTPSCSQYTVEALEAYGFWRGLGLGLRRLMRCHPFQAGGYDPVPPAPGRDGAAAGEIKEDP